MTKPKTTAVAKVAPHAKTKAVAKPAAHAVAAAPASESMQFMHLLREVSTDPNFDAAKMEMVLRAQERILDRNAKAAFDAALEAMIPKFPAIAKAGKIDHGTTGRGTQGVKAKFARWQDIHKVITPILRDHGFSLTYRTDVTEDGKVLVVAVLAGYGWREEARYRMPPDTSGGKNSNQGYGSSTAYAKRYLACAILNLSTDDDVDGLVVSDDGNAVSTVPTISEDQASALLDKMDVAGMKAQRFMESYEIERIADLPAKKFDEAVRRIKEFGEEKARKKKQEQEQAAALD